MVYDYVVIGASVSGSTFARKISSDYKVLVVDKRPLDKENIFKAKKPCGGLLNHTSQGILKKEKLSVPKEVIVQPNVKYVKAFDMDSNISKIYKKDYINVNRELFDRWLFSLIGKDVTKMLSTVYKRHRREGNLYIVELASNKKTIHVLTKNIVFSNGAKNTSKTYVSLQKHYKIDYNISYYIAHFNKKVTDYYSWGINKEDTLIIGTAVRRGVDIKKSFDILLSDIKSLGFHLGEEIYKESTLISKPDVRDINIGKDTLFNIGERANLISPSSSDGISYALRSGIYLAESINKYKNNAFNSYSKKVNRLKVDIFTKSLKAKIMYNRDLRKLIMKSGILSNSKY